MDDGASTLMSIRDAARATGLSPKALRRRIERGTLTSVMIGGRRRIPMEALARRGLIASGHDPVTGHRVVERPSPAVEAITDQLHRLESRVSALEAVLSQRVRDGVTARDPVGDGVPVADGVTARDPVGDGVPVADGAAARDPVGDDGRRVRAPVDQGLGAPASEGVGAFPPGMLAVTVGAPPARGS
jgi:excisionase family DNA binding protein